MGLRTFANKVLRNQGGIQRLRRVRREARYSPWGDPSGKPHIGGRETTLRTSEAQAPFRRMYISDEIKDFQRRGFRRRGARR